MEPQEPVMFRKCRRLGYAWLVLNGVFYVLAPRLALKLSTKIMLLGYENAGELEPRDWYATSTRAAGVGMIAAGIAGLLLEREPAAADEPDEQMEDEDDEITIETAD